MSFCTVINCMDGRVQLPVIRFLQRRFGAAHVDAVTEPGPCRSLAEQADSPAVDSILRRVSLSVERHGSRKLAVVAHDDCAGNPTDKASQLADLERAVCFLRQCHDGLEVIGLWVDLEGRVAEIFAHLESAPDQEVLGALFVP